MPIPTTPISQLTVRHTSSASVHNIPYAIVDGTDRATTLRLEFMNAGGTTIQSVVLLDPGGTDKPLVKQAGKLSLVAGRPNAWIYTLADADHPTAGTYTIQITFSNVVSLIARVETWSGVTQAGLNTADSLGAPTPVEGSGPAASITVASEVGGLVLDCLDVYGTGTVTLAPGAGQTSDNNDTLPNIGAGGTSHTAGAASVVMSWSLSGQLNWVYCAIALAPASTNTPPTVEIDEKASIGSAIYLPVGASIQLHATITDPDPADAGLTPSWSSDTPAVATVDASTGVVTAVAQGQAIVKASALDTASQPGSDTITILVDNDPTTGSATIILGDNMKEQELREAGVDTVVNVELHDSNGDLLTTNPLVSGDVTISINRGAPTTLLGDAGLSALAPINGLLPIPVAAAELPSAGDRVTLLVKDRDGTAYRARTVEILVFRGNPAVPETSTDIAAATKIKVEETGSILNGLNTIVTPARMGFLDNLNVGGLVAAQQEVLSIQNNTSAVRSVPQFMERPASGTRSYIIEILLYNTTGGMATPDQPPALSVTNETGVSRADHLDVTSMTEVSGGRYRATYTLQPTDVKEQLRFAFTVIENGVSREYTNTSNIVDVIAADFTTADRTILQNLDGRLDDPRAALLDNLSRLDAAVSTLLTAAAFTAAYVAPDNATIAATKAIADRIPASPAAVGSPMVVQSIVTAAQDALVADILTRAPAAGVLSLHHLAAMLKLAFQGTATGASDSPGTTVLEHPELPGYSLSVTDADKFGNRAAAATFVTP